MLNSHFILNFIEIYLKKAIITEVKKGVNKAIIIPSIEP
jgi:hypothetical protein